MKPVTLMAASLPRTPLRRLIPDAAAAGFSALTCWPNMWRHAERRDNFGLAAIRAMLDDHGVAVTDVELVDDWCPADAGPFPAGLSRAEAFEAAIAFGATTVDTAHAVGGRLVLDRDAEAFASLCDDAARTGLKVSLEFVPFTAIPDLDTALTFLERVARPNAGLVVDVSHLARSGGRPDDLRRIPAESIFTVQLADGPASAPADLIDEAINHRLLPGAGELRVVECLAVLMSMGVSVPVGPEVFSRAGEENPAARVADLFRATTDVLDRARNLAAAADRSLA